MTIPSSSSSTCLITDRDTDQGPTSVQVTSGPVGPRCDYTFRKDQPWSKTPKNISFVDETAELVNIYEQDEDNEGSSIVQDTPDNPASLDASADSPPSAPEPSIASPRDERPGSARTASFGSSIVDSVGLSGKPLLASSRTWLLKIGRQKTESSRVIVKFKRDLTTRSTKNVYCNTFAKPNSIRDQR